MSDEEKDRLSLHLYGTVPEQLVALGIAPAFLDAHRDTVICHGRIPCAEVKARIAATLSRGVPFLRVDFYEVNGRMYFGELTFFPASGFCPFTPDEWNERLGDKIPLPTK